MTATITSVPQSAKEFARMNDTQRKFSARVQRMLDRADALFVDGYRAEEILDRLYRVTSPKGDCYVVNLRDWTCECNAFKLKMYTDTKGRTSCKHLVGCRQLVKDQNAPVVSFVDVIMAHDAYRSADNEVNRLIERMDAAVNEAERLYYARQCAEAEQVAQSTLAAWEAVR